MLTENGCTRERKRILQIKESSKGKWHYLQDVYVVLENYIPFDTERGDNS